MLNFGTASDHSNEVYLTDRLDGPTSYTYFAWLRPDDWAGKGANVLGHFSATNGIVIRRGGTTDIEVLHGDNSATTTVNGTTDFTDVTIESLMVHWDGSNCDYYKGGVADGTPALTRGTGAPTGAWTIGNYAAGGTGGAGGHIGQVMYWHNEDRSADIVNLHSGKVIDGFATMDIWHRGTNLTGPNEAPADNDVFTNSGATYTSYEPDLYYTGNTSVAFLISCMVGMVAPWKEIFGQALTYRETFNFMSRKCMNKSLGGDFGREWEGVRDYLRRGTVWAT